VVGVRVLESLKLREDALYLALQLAASLLLKIPVVFGRLDWKFHLNPPSLTSARNVPTLQSESVTGAILTLHWRPLALTSVYPSDRTVYGP